MTPEEAKRELAQHIKLLEANIERSETFADAVSRNYFGKVVSPRNARGTLNELRALQEHCENNPEAAEHRAKVRTLDEKGDLKV